MSDSSPPAQSPAAHEVPASLVIREPIQDPSSPKLRGAKLRESMRGWLAIGFSASYVVVAMASAYFILFSDGDEKRVTTLFSTVMPTFGALVGTIIGFYFGESKGEGSPSDH